ncbi:MAG: type II toxin-antitoxin system VapC family toxin [Candidatus Brocadiaceae bacterium]|nr:type II toxin-antitoxin system VapC family toxin [Candidatus Brocadiaceae bacterium]
MNLPWIYIDTSAYLKIFLKERGSDKVRKLVKENNLLASAILISECFSAFSRRRQGKEIDVKIFERLVNRVKKDVPYIEIVRLTDDVLRRTEEILLQSSVRTLDAVHIASALLFQETTGIDLTFATADKRQAEFTNDKGLKAVFVG